MTSAEIKSELRVLQDEVSTLRLRCAILDGDNTDLAERIREGEGAKLELTSAYAMLRAKDEEISRMVSAECVVQSQLRDAKDHILAASITISQLQNEIRVLKESESQSHTEVAALKSEVQSLRNQLEEAAQAKRAREEDEVQDVKRRCVSPEVSKVFSLTAFGALDAIGSVVASLIQLRTFQVLKHDEMYLSLTTDEIVKDTVTHVIVPNDNTKITLKLLSALVKGRWVVPVAYLTASLENRTWLKEEDFGIRYEAPPLLGKKCYVKVSDRHQGTAERLVECGGGSLVQSTLRADISITNWGDFSNQLVHLKL